MGITWLTFSDALNGRRLMEWVNEVLYSIGPYADFDKLSLPTGEQIVLALVCLPPSLAGAAKYGTSKKRAAGEFWSTVEVDYDGFNSDDPCRKVESIALALVDAIQQVPDARLPIQLKADILAAIAAGATDLRNNPRRHPR